MFPIRPPAWLFLRELLRDPGAIGALCASSERLAERIARQVDLRQEGWVVELGAGTGVVTAALLRHGVHPERLLVIERSAELAHHLRVRFPHLRIICGDALLGRALVGMEGPIAALVSGLPLRSLPALQVAQLTRAWGGALGQGARVIQFTYVRHGVSAWLSAGLLQAGGDMVWANLPPARIDVFAVPDQRCTSIASRRFT